MTFACLPQEMRWRIEWASESPEYGGRGTPVVESPEGEWTLPGETAVVLAPGPASPSAD